MAASMTITHLTHDLAQKKSFVSFVWTDDPSKRLGLEVPYGTALAEIEAAAEKAVAELVSELQTASRVLP
ncbi:hypothetical protein [Devosia salina]|uniref:Uncharacterized protein n=1 Tax=Devosia salina TaxID=2860336 RepID=A0ABX8WFM5_9HYPH|nr:hypothetical protein [Devosia salina]QYO76864.1 hypothetical protein K1X15_20230 [Devosia salina]